MNTIKWTHAAEDSYLTILEDLRTNWNDDVAYNFYISVDNEVEIIAFNFNRSLK